MVAGMEAEPARELQKRDDHKRIEDDFSLRQSPFPVASYGGGKGIWTASRSNGRFSILILGTSITPAFLRERKPVEQERGARNGLRREAVVCELHILPASR